MGNIRLTVFFAISKTIKEALVSIVEQWKEVTPKFFLLFGTDIEFKIAENYKDWNYWRYGIVVDEGKQQQICAEHTNSKCVGPDSVVIADKSVRVDVTSPLAGVIKNSCGIDA